MNRIQRIALIVGGVGLALSLLGFFLNREQFFQAYIFVYLFWLGPAVGSLGMLLLANTVGGRWGLVVRRFAEAGAWNIALMAAFFIPILFGMSYIYIWADPAAVAASPLLQHKSLYLNTSFFIARAVIYFVIWLGLTFLLRSWSLAQDRTGDPGFRSRMTTLSPPALVVFVLTVTFASFDWGMSLEPRWNSSIYGVLYIVSYGLMSLAWVVVLLYLFGFQPPMLSIMQNPERLHDIGKLMFAFTIIWAYVNFAQYLIQWAGNLPEEIEFYLARVIGGWQFLGIILIFGQFFIPFFLLLMRRNKRRIRSLVKIAIAILAMQVVYFYWMIVPAFSPFQFTISWMHLTLFAGVGGIFIGVYMRTLKLHSLVPQKDEMLEFATRQPHHAH